MTAASTVARDVTERRRADDHRGLLVAELDHRVKNMLAVVSSLAAQTLRTAGSPENFVTTFQGRLKALSQVQRLLTQSNWRSEEHTSELQSLMRISYAVFCLKKKNQHSRHSNTYVD